MSSYSSGETLLASVIRTVSGFTTANTTIGQWGVLNSGASDHYAIIRKGQHTRAYNTPRMVENTYRTIVEVWQRYKDDGNSYQSLLSYVDSIAETVDQYRKLSDNGSTVLDATYIGSGDVIAQWRNKGDGPSWLRVDMTIEWKEQEITTYAE